MVLLQQLEQWVNMSEVKVNTIKKYTGSSITIGESGDTITVTAGATLSGSGASLTALNATQLGSGTIPNARYGTPTFDGSNLTNLPAETKPTISSISPSTIENTASNVVITGTNFVSVPYVDAVSSTGAITPANSVTFTSATSITANFTLGTDGTYYLRVENPDGNAVRSSSALLTVSDAPVWTTGAGSLGTIAGGFSGTVATVAATGDTIVYSETTSVLTNAAQANCSLNSATGAITTSDFGGSSTSATTYSFTLRATDAQAQTADRNFTLTSSFTIGNSGRFDT
jgi:hypothetical protein